MLDPDVKITNQVEDRRIDADTQTFVPIIRVSFKVGTHGPFIQKFDKADFSQLTRDLALNAFAREVRT